MVSPARRHYQKALAAEAAKATADDQPVHNDAHQLMQAALVDDRRRLHDIQSIEKKIELKHELLPKYDPYIDGVLEGGTGTDDDVLMLLMIWHLDVGKLQRALAIAQYALQHGLNPPDSHRRTTATIVAEESAEQILRNFPADPEALANTIALAQELMALTEPHDMPDQVRAKQHKALGHLLTAVGTFEAKQAAIAAYGRAVELDERAGVKKNIEKLERELKNSVAQSS